MAVVAGMKKQMTTQNLQKSNAKKKKKLPFNKVGADIVLEHGNVDNFLNLF